MIFKCYINYNSYYCERDFKLREFLNILLGGYNITLIDHH